MLKKLLYQIGGLLLVIGAVLPLFSLTYGAYTFTAGALLFCPLQMLDRYEGKNLIIRRLRRQQLFGALMLLITAALMLCSLWQLPPFRGQEWKIALMIATVLELYAVFRIDKEESREES